MKRSFLIFSILISFCCCGVARADGTEKIYIDPKVAQKVIEKHFSHVISEYFRESKTNLDDKSVLVNVIDAYNRMLKLNNGLASVDGIVGVCETAFSEFYLMYDKDTTIADRVKLFNKKCVDFAADLLAEESGFTGSDCPYRVTKVNGSQATIKYELPDNSGFIRSGGSIAWRFFNPGNLRGSDLQCTTIRTKTNGNFAVFPDAKTGRLALHKLLSENSSYRDLTVRKAIYKYAPPSQNNTVGYINKLRNAGINVDAKLSSLSDSEMTQLEEMIMTIEGWKVSGTETRF